MNTSLFILNCIQGKVISLQDMNFSHIWLPPAGEGDDGLAKVLGFPPNHHHLRLLWVEAKYD